jgi:rod shape-determining protein MreC
VPRNRTVRLAVLGSSVQRAAEKYPSRGGLALRRRLVVGVLVVLSLLLITIYFRESSTGGLHNLQGAAATVLRPFQVGAERVSSPFRDAYGWFDGLVDAKSENDRLRAEVESLRQQVLLNQTALQENRQLRDLLDYRAPAAYPNGVDLVTASVIGYPALFQQHITISAGSNDGLARNDPVVNSRGLVGIVDDVTPRTAKVVLLTDQTSFVSALDTARSSGARGLIQAGRAGSGSLVLNQVGKDEVVREGDRIVTAGSRRGELESLYPRGIPIGMVTFVGQSDTDPYQRIQVEPFVDFDSLESVIVLVPRNAAR